MNSGDGSSNADEYAAGTYPNDAASVFKVLTVTKAGAVCTVTVLGKASRSYVLERRTSLVSADSAFYRVQTAVP